MHPLARLVIGLALSAVGVLAVVHLAPVPPIDPQAAAFRILPWSRIAAPPDPDGVWRIGLGSVEGVSVRVLATSCGCARAAVEEGALEVEIAAERRPREITLYLAVTVAGGARALRRVRLQPHLPVPPRSLFAVAHHVRTTAEDVPGMVHGRAHFDQREPPRLVSAAPLQLRTRPAPGGGHDVWIHGLAPRSALRDPGHLLTSRGRVPLRIYRRLR